MSDQIVVLLITPGKHGMTEHRFALIDGIQENYVLDLNRFSSATWKATYEFALDEARALAATHSTKVVELTLGDTFYHLKKVGHA